MSHQEESSKKSRYVVPAIFTLSLGVASGLAATGVIAGGGGHVALCHMPDSAAAHVLVVPEHAVEAHLGHGDFLLGGKGGGGGVCE